MGWQLLLRLWPPFRVVCEALEAPTGIWGGCKFRTVTEACRHCSRVSGSGCCNSWQLNVPENPKNYFNYSYSWRGWDRLGKFKINRPCNTFPEWLAYLCANRGKSLTHSFKVIKEKSQWKIERPMLVRLCGLSLQVPVPLLTCNITWCDCSII